MMSLNQVTFPVIDLEQTNNFYITLCFTQVINPLAMHVFNMLIKLRFH